MFKEKRYHNDNSYKGLCMTNHTKTLLIMVTRSLSQWNSRISHRNKTWICIHLMKMHLYSRIETKTKSPSKPINFSIQNQLNHKIQMDTYNSWRLNKNTIVRITSREILVLNRANSIEWENRQSQIKPATLTISL